MGKRNGIQSEKEAGLVMGTNGSSIVSKRSVERIYSPEPHFFRYFVKKPQRRAPLINRGYWLRMRAIEHSVRQFLKQPSKHPKLILNFGCGFDPVPFQFLSREPELCENARFIDVDHRKLMLEKWDAIQKNPGLHNIIPDAKLSNEENAATVIRSEKYIGIGCDLGDLQGLGAALRSEMDTSKFSILCTAEVSLTYMDVKAANALIHWASELSNNVQFCLLEQYFPDGPDHPFAKTMMKHFSKLGAPLHSIHTYPSLSHQEQRFTAAGWKHAKARSLWEIWSDPEFLNEEERRSLDKFEPFDEWEEFAMFAAHYFLLSASTWLPETCLDSSPASKDSSAVDEQENKGNNAFKLRALCPQKFNGQRRFGATVSGSGGSGTVGLHGGLGRQTRLASTDFYGNSDLMTIPSGAPPETISARMCHTITHFTSDDCLLVGGRTSPTTVLGDCWLRRGGNWKQVHDLPTQRFRHSSTCVNMAANDEHVLIYGGKTKTGEILGDFLIWNEAKGWQPVKVAGQSTVPRFGAAMVSVDGKFGVLSGGISESGAVLNDCWTWNLSQTESGEYLITLTDHTESIKSISPLLFKWLGRFGASANLMEGNLVIVGGVSTEGWTPEKYEIIHISEDGLWDLKTGRSPRDTILTSGRLGEDCNGPRPLLVGHSALAVEPRKLLIVGGGAVCFSFGTFWNAGTWLLEETLSDEGNDWRLIEPSTESELSSSVMATPNVSESLIVAADPVTIPRVKIGSAQDFNAVVDAGKPVIIEGLHFGSCRALWGKEYLKKAVGHERKITVHDSTADHMDFQNKNFSYVPKGFGAFIDEIYAGSRQYLRSVSAEKPLQRPAKLDLDFPGLKDDFQLPPELAQVSENAHSSPLRISGPVILWLHYDVLANVLCQVHGEKTLILYPPGDVSLLKVPPGSSSSSINVFQTPSNDDNISPISPPGTHPHEAVMKPGDILFIPPLWMHTACPTSGVSIAVNVFFRNLPDQHYANGRDVYGNRDLQAYENGRKAVEKITRSFDQLPQDIARFYLDRLADELREKKKKK